MSHDKYGKLSGEKFWLDLDVFGKTSNEQDVFALLATASVESDDENKIDLVIADSDTEFEAISDFLSDTESEDIHVDRLDAIVHNHLVGINTCFENSFLY